MHVRGGKSMHGFETLRGHLSIHKWFYIFGILVISLLVLINYGYGQVVLVPTSASQSSLYAVEQQFNIPYGPLSQERLNLCLPKGALDLRPGVITIHSGGWIGGANAEFQSACIILAEHGFVVANVNYRLAEQSVPSTQWPAQLVDVQLAVRWMRSQANKLHLDPQRLCSWGASAGGHLAVFLGVLKAIHRGDEAPLLVNESPSVSCVVDDYGPIDLTRPNLDSLTSCCLRPLFGDTHPELYRDASPVFDVTAQSAPMQIVQGTRDTIVPPAQSEELESALQNNHVPVQYISYQGDHLLVGLTRVQTEALISQSVDYIVAHERP